MTSKLQNGTANHTTHTSDILSKDTPIEDLPHINSSNEFILTNPDENHLVPIKKWLQQTFSKKLLLKRIPILSWLPNYDKTSAVSDLIAGITVGLTVIPQGLAYSSIVGVPPQYGLYSSFVGCLVYIIFGSCPETAIGPTAMAAMLTGDAIKGKGPQYATLLCLLTGIVQVLMGLFKFGFLIDFISGPVSSGFISASAIVILTSQMKDILGIQASGDSFVAIWKEVIENIEDTKTWDAVMGFICLIVLLIMRGIGKLKIGPSNKDVPLNRTQKFLNTTFWLIGIARSTIVVVICTYISYYQNRDNENPFTVTGYVPSGFPTIQPPSLHYIEVKNNTVVKYENFFHMVTDLSCGIFAVPLIGLLEDIGVCTAFANGKPVDATQEFIAVGLSNVANSFVQGFPGTGALARSAVNHSSGVKTTFGGFYTGALVISSLFFFTPYFYYIPKPTLAAIIIAASIFMVEYKVVRPMWKAKKSDLVPGIATFIGCLILPFQYGILIGVGINLTSIMYHAARPKISMEKLRSSEGENYLLLKPDRCLMFPSVNYVRHLVTKHSLRQGIPVVIDCTYIYGADYTAATVIKILTEDFASRKQPLFFYNIKPSVGSVIHTLATEEFQVYYDCDEFDEMLRRWRIKRNMQTEDL
ncbi:hypothetical protein Zmor_022997 [Zophobas morio]|uniref:SLC26A/SulP transporter domain-containing protein n=1 Tax=Zophobas morio TaxID=2755281 RepID=A0AA38HXD7_9CUCU|nr:hypothetical protein Zmor_022997 [Zophobas morio]